MKGRDKITDKNSKLFGLLKDEPFNPYHGYKNETVLDEAGKALCNDMVNHPEKFQHILNNLQMQDSVKPLNPIILQRKEIQNMNEIQKETAIQNEQQFKTKQEIIKDIIKILADNNLSIADSKDILYETSKSICRQIVKVSP